MRHVKAFAAIVITFTVIDLIWLELLHRVFMTIC